MQWETNCEYVLGTLREFNQWQTGESLDGNPFKNFKTNNHWGYLDYKHMAEIFPAKALQVSFMYNIPSNIQRNCCLCFVVIFYDSESVTLTNRKLIVLSQL